LAWSFRSSGCKSAARQVLCACGLEEIWAAFDPALSAIVVALHTISHLTVSGLIAWLVYNFVGLAVLRHTWINVDLIWCCSLLGAGAVLLFVPIA
jgi:hypothetical protein